MHRNEVLDTARQLVTNDRVKHYGTPKENFTRIANMWSEIFKTRITPAQVALCMAIVKVTRLIQTPDHEDSWVDLAGYAACGGEVIETTQKATAGGSITVHDRSHLAQQVNPIYHGMMKPKDNQVTVPAMYGGMVDEG